MNERKHDLQEMAKVLKAHKQLLGGEYEKARSTIDELLKKAHD